MGLAVLGLTSVPTTAWAGTDDYPAQWRNAAQDSLVDSWGYYNRECTSFVAWRLHARNGFEMPRAIGNGGTWGSWFAAHGYAVNNSPAVGAIAETSSHVAWVEAVNGNGTITIEEYNFNFQGTYNERTVAVSGFHYIHAKDLAGGSPPPPPHATMGNYNGDLFSDVGILHQLGDGGMNAHVLWGSTGTPFQFNPTFTRNLPGSAGWDWTKIKTANGDFNNDGYEDIALVHQLADDGADVHVLWGSSGTPFGYNPTFTRRLPASDGWRWSQMKLVAGKFNPDAFSDVAILHQIGDGGIDVHILYGSTGTPFQFNPTFTRTLPAFDGWDWTKIKTASGYFNDDTYEDVAVLKQRADGGADVHVLWGSVGTPFGYNPTFARTLPGSDGWDWTKMKLASGKFNGDSFSDVAILHQISDGGFDAHILYGSVGTPFQFNPTFARRLPGTDGWDWNKIKTTSGDFNNDGFDDIAVVHQIPDDGADVHVLWGSVGTPFGFNPTFARSLPASEGWRWSQMKIVSRTSVN